MRVRAAAALIWLLASTGSAAAGSLYDALGERDGLVRLVDAATVVWLADTRVKGSFAETNIDRFKRMLVDQLCQLTGGGCTYRGQHMAAAHRGLHLDTRAFNALVEDLEATMDGLDVPSTVQNRLLALLAPMYRDVVTR